MTNKAKQTRETKDEIRDRKRDRDGWKAARKTARKLKSVRRDFEQGEKF